MSFSGSGSTSGLFNSAPDSLLVPYDGVPLVPLGHPSGTDGSIYDVHWAIWNNDSGGNSKLFSDFSNNLAFETINNELVSVAVIPLDINKLEGSNRTFIGGFGTETGFLGGSATGVSSGWGGLQHFVGFFDTTIDLSSGSSISDGYLPLDSK